MVASLVRLAETLVMTGGVVDTTVMVNEPVPVLPAASVALTVMVWRPMLNRAPEVGRASCREWVIDTTATASVDVDALKLTLEPAALVASLVRFAETLLMT